MQGSQEGKCANSWGPHAHFGPKIPMKMGPEYQGLKELGQNSNVYKNSTGIQNGSKDRIRITMFKKIAPAIQ